MGYFRYKARTIAGEAKKGKISAGSRDEALIALRGDGLIIFEVQELNQMLYKEIHIGSPVKNKDFILFLRQYSTLIDAGITLVEATAILADQMENKYLKQALFHIKESLEKGTTLSDAFAEYPKIFPELLVSMIHAGEVSGNLDEILDNMATYYEKQYRLKQKVISALTYPIVLGVMSVFVCLFLLAFIVPVFTDMLGSFGSDIPAYTAFVLSLSGFVSSYWWLIIATGALLAVVYKYLETHPKFAYSIDLMKLKVPVFGKFIQKSLVARMTQTLSSLLNSSVPILQAVDITERVIPNRVVKKVLSQSKTSLEQGESLAVPMEKHWVFPKLVTQMIAVGESSGSLDSMLKKVADFYEQELDEAADKLKSLIEPVMIVVLAGVVGSIVLAIIIPMFAIFDSIQM